MVSVFFYSQSQTVEFTFHVFHATFLFQVEKF